MKLQVRSAVADVPRRGWQQLPDAAAGGGASEDLRRSEESADGRIDLSRLRARFGSRLDRHGPADNGRVRSARLLLQHRVPEPAWDLRSFNFDSDMTHTDQTVGRLGNATSTDYAAAIRRGVKIIQYHGWNDQTLQPAYSPQYYEQVAKANGGLEKTQEFYRLFMVPGLAHCSGGIGASNFGGVGQQIPPVRDAAHDLVTATGELGRARHAAGSVHRDEIHRQPGHDAGPSSTRARCVSIRPCRDTRGRAIRTMPRTSRVFSRSE